MMRMRHIKLVVTILVCLAVGTAEAGIPLMPIINNQAYRGTATLDLDFIHDTYWLNGTTYSGVSNFVTGAGATYTRAGTTSVTWAGSAFYTESAQGQSFVSRASSGTYFDSSGTLQTAGTNTDRNATYSYSGGAWTANTGSLIEPAVTNGIRNNTMSGAVAADGVELASSGTFGGCAGAACAGWTTTVNGGTGTVSFGSNTATLTGDGANAASIYQGVTTVSGYQYFITVTTGAGQAVTLQIGSSAGGSQYRSATSISASTTSSYQIKATGTTVYFQINNANASAATVTSVSIQSAGALPTNWNRATSVAGATILTKVVGTGTESGISYIELRFTGTASSGIVQTQFETSSATAAATGQTWVPSVYEKLTAGSLTGVNVFYFDMGEANSGGTYVTGNTTTVTSPTNSGLSTQRVSASRTLTAPSVAYIYAPFCFSTTNNATIDFTIRLGMPQIENSTSATSVISTSGAAASRSADVVSFPSGGTYFNSSGVMKQTAVDTPRLDYGFGGGNYPKGVLIEESRTNYVSNNTMQSAVVADGVERITTGTFASCSGASCTGWTTTVNGGTGTVSFASSTATLTGDGANAASIYQSVPTVSGNYYIIAVTTGAGQSVTVRAGTAAGGTNLLASSTVAASSTTSYQFTATSTTSYIQINNTSSSAATVTTVSTLSGGKIPTNWGLSGSAGPYGHGIMTSVTGAGTSNGMSYIDIKFIGTPVDSTFINIFTDNTHPVASNGQSWVHSFYAAIPSGSTTNVTSLTMQCGIYSAANAYLGEIGSQSLLTATSSLAYYYITGTISNASASYLIPYFQFHFTSGSAVNITVRIAMPQLELGGMPTSIIPTWGSTVTRAADVFTVPVTATGASGAWFTAGTGTMGAQAYIPYTMPSTSSARFASIDDGTTSNDIGLLAVLSTKRAYFQMNASGVSNFDSYIATSASTGTFKSLAAFTVNDSNGAAMGSAMGAQVSATIPTVTTLQIGGAAGSRQMTGWVQRFWYMPTREADASLAGYTV